MLHDPNRSPLAALLRSARPARTVAALLAALAASAPLHADVLELSPSSPQTGAQFGESVGGIPDINGDGVDDVLVGAPNTDVNGVSNAGRVTVFSGRTGAIVRSHVSPVPTTNGRFGEEVEGLDDINGDGRGDYLVGAPLEASGAGRAYLYSGANGALLRTIVSPNAEVNGWFGSTIAAVPDLTGDDVNDYMISAFNESVGSVAGSGRVYIYNGKTGALVRTVKSPNSEAAGGFGRSLTGCPDANGDGLGDYAIGAPTEQPSGTPADSGRVYAYSGANGALLRTYLPTTPQLVGWFGWAIAAIPSLDAGGVPELAIGSPNQDVTVAGQDFPGAGVVEVFSFGPGTYYALRYQSTGFLVEGNQFGFSIAAIPDVYGPGRGGFLVGCPRFNRAYLYGIMGVGQSISLDEVFVTPDTTGTDQFWSGAVANAGDANGDGRTDFIIGGRGSDGVSGGPANAGRASLHRRVLNNGCTFLAEPPLLQDGPNAASTLGATVSPNLPNCGAWSGNPGPDTWFRYSASCSGRVTFSTCGGSFDTLLAVYDGCTYPLIDCDLSVLIGCNDNGGPCQGGGSSVTVQASTGDCFIVRLGGVNGASGTATMTVRCEPCPADRNGDLVVDAADLSAVLSGWGTASGDVNGDGITNAADISVLLGSWGACP